MPIRAAALSDVEALSDLAARTFPLAAPDDAAPDSLDDFIAQNLSAARFTEYVTDPACDVLVHDDEGGLGGYVLLVTEEPADPDVVAALSLSPTIMLSKFYVDPAAHGSGLAASLMLDAFSAAEARGVAGMWLGVNQENERAHRFYEKQGFQRVGTKRFQVGARLEHDFVYERPVRAAR